MGKILIKIRMRLYILFLMLIKISAKCCTKKDSWKECQNWAAFMPGFWWHHHKSKNECCLKRQGGWHKESNEDFVAGQSRAELVWKNTKLVGGVCEDCGPTGCSS